MGLHLRPLLSTCASAGRGALDRKLPGLPDRMGQAEGREVLEAPADSEALVVPAVVVAAAAVAVALVVVPPVVPAVEGAEACPTRVINTR